MPKQPSASAIVSQLKRQSNEKYKHNVARLGIPAQMAIGVPVPVVRQIAKELGHDQQLADQLWQTGFHEARLLAVLVAEPERIPMATIEHWLAEIVSWDLCDHLCNNLLIAVPACAKRIPKWAKDEREFVRRAAFALINSLSIHRTGFANDHIGQYLKLIRAYAHDPRNYVKKAVSWALREIGKKERDYGALRQATALATELSLSKNAAERWVGKDALKELESLVAVEGRKRLVAKRRLPKSLRLRKSVLIPS
jgi:3-methyladenine DNA glycosylase AlkD